jgi:TonB family protein
MIRLFAPPTRDGLVRANGITAASLVLHLAVGVALFVPLAQAVRADLIDRLVVFLIPPNQTGGREAGHGMLPVPAAFQAGPRATGLDQGGAASRIEAPGVAAAARVSDTPEADQLLPGDNALTVIEVDSEVVRDPTSAAPEYPPQLLSKGLEGWAMVRYVVDTLGQVDTLTYRVVQATHAGFAHAVRLALPNMRFRPAMQGGNRVRQLVEQTFRFRISPSDSSRPTPRA